MGKEKHQARRRIRAARAAQESPEQTALRELTKAVEAFDAAAIDKITGEYGYDLMGAVIQEFLNGAVENTIMGPAYADFLQGEFKGTAVQFKVPEALLPPEIATTVITEEAPVVAATTGAEPAPQTAPEEPAVEAEPEPEVTAFQLPESISNDPRFSLNNPSKPNPQDYKGHESYAIYRLLTPKVGFGHTPAFYIDIADGRFYVSLDQKSGISLEDASTLLAPPSYPFEQLEKLVSLCREITVKAETKAAPAPEPEPEGFCLPESVTNDPNFQLLGPADPEKVKNFAEYANYLDARGEIAFTIVIEDGEFGVYAGDDSPYYDESYTDERTGTMFPLDEAIFEFNRLEAMVNACRAAVENAPVQSLYAPAPAFEPEPEPKSVFKGSVPPFRHSGWRQEISGDVEAGDTIGYIAYRGLRDVFAVSVEQDADNRMVFKLTLQVDDRPESKELAALGYPNGTSFPDLRPAVTAAQHALDAVYDGGLLLIDGTTPNNIPDRLLGLFFTPKAGDINNLCTPAYAVVAKSALQRQLASIVALGGEGIHAASIANGEMCIRAAWDLLQISCQGEIDYEGVAVEGFIQEKYGPYSELSEGEVVGYFAVKQRVTTRKPSRFVYNGSRTTTRDQLTAKVEIKKTMQNGDLRFKVEFDSSEWIDTAVTRACNMQKPFKCLSAAVAFASQQYEKAQTAMDHEPTPEPTPPRRGSTIRWI